MQVSGHITRLEATLSGSIRRVQLDNQMLDATQPVVLASASVAHARSDTAQSLTGDEGPLVSFGMTRSFANTIVASGESNSAGSNPSPGNRMSAGASPNSNWDQGNKMGDNPSAILSFKDIHLRVGEMDFQADDGFLEAILSFVVSIPTADIWQDEAWREQQRRLLTAQFGPKEVESLATNAVLPIQETVHEDEDPLQWVIEKELHELEVTHLPHQLLVQDLHMLLAQLALVYSSYFCGFMHSCPVGPLPQLLTVSPTVRSDSWKALQKLTQLR